MAIFPFRLKTILKNILLKSQKWNNKNQIFDFNISHFKNIGWVPGEFDGKELLHSKNHSNVFVNRLWLYSSSCVVFFNKKN